MASLQGSETEKNLLKSFVGESQARNQYDFFASAAKKEGYVQIAAVFTETANQEKEHAKRFFKLLADSELEFAVSCSSGKIGTTLENLTASAAGENEEWTELYPAFAQTAKEEGFPQIAALWMNISVAEQRHDERFKAFLELLESGQMFAREEKQTWRCRNCGYVHQGPKAAKVCPACDHPQAHFEASLGLLSL